MNDLFLVEVVPDDFDPNGATVISLSPQSSSDLAEQGVDFSIPEDYCPLDELNSSARPYSQVFAEWIDSLDGVITKRYPSLAAQSIRPASLLGYHIGLAVDPFVIKALQLRAILAEQKPSKIVLFTYERTITTADCPLYMRDNRFWSRMTRLCCETSEVAFDERSFPYPKPPADLVGQSLSSGKQWIKRIIRSTQGKVDALGRDDRDKPSVLCVGAQGWTDEAESDLIQMGYRILRDNPPKRAAPRVSTVDTGLPHSGDILESYKGLNDFVGFEWTGLISDLIDYLVSTVCAQLDSEISRYTASFSERHIRIVMCPSKSSMTDFAAIAAAKANPDVLAVQVTHGYSTLALQGWRYTERPEDLYVTLDEELSSHFSATVHAEADTSVRVNRLWTAVYDRLSPEASASHRSSSDSGATVLYIPTLYAGDVRSLDAASYGDTWYFRHQLGLLDYFSSRKDVRFIWKALPQSEGASNPIPSVIDRLGITNVKWETGPLKEYFAEADYALHDYPSTPLLETVLLSIPTLCLYHRSLWQRESAKSRFGKILQPFSDTREAAERIGDFLEADPGEYVRTLKMGSSSFREIIQEFTAPKESL